MKTPKVLFLGTVLGLTVLAAGCRKQPEESAQPTPEQVAQEETNKFLTDQGIKLPEGAQRAYLSGQIGSRGVVTKEMESSNKMVTYTIVASLPDIKTGVYQGFISDGTAYKSLGYLRQDKGGYVGEKTLSASGLESFNQVVVSQGSNTASPSAEVMLTGQF